MKGFWGGSLSLVRLDKKPKKFGMFSGPKLCLFICMFNVFLRLKMDSSFAAWAPCLLDVCL